MIYGAVNKTIILVITLVLVGGFSLFFFNNATQKQQTAPSIETSTTTQKKSNGDYSGNVIAGKKTPYLEFTKADYDKARAQKKIIVLNFYATWCPVCRSEAPAIAAGFDSLQLENVVGFRVNYKDDQTDSDEKALANDFTVPYQHTKIILKDGKQVFNETTQWTQEQVVETVTQFSQ